jgi:hypothetical protein
MHFLMYVYLLCDWFYILWLQPCKDVLEHVNKYNTIQKEHGRILRRTEIDGEARMLWHTQVETSEENEEGE